MNPFSSDDFIIWEQIYLGVNNWIKNYLVKMRGIKIFKSVIRLQPGLCPIMKYLVGAT